MGIDWKIVIVALVGSLVGFAFEPDAPIGHALWPAATTAETPSATQVTLLVVEGAIEAIGFGVGVAFLAFGLPRVKRALPSRSAVLVWISIAWLLMNWIPHDSLHRTDPALSGLIAIEYGFHVTLIAAGMVLAFAMYRVTRPISVGGDRARPAHVVVTTAQR